MRFRPRSETQSLLRIRAKARAPRAALILASVVLAAVGLKSLLSPVPVPAPVKSDASTRDVGAAAFAEAFARAYFTFDSGSPESRDRALERFMPRSRIGAIESVPRSDESVRWSTIAAERPAGLRRRVVTVALQTSTTLRHLAVTVGRDDRGFLFVASAPAVVGPPPTAEEQRMSTERDVEDGELRTVATRVVKNYLAREREDLAADLDPEAVVSLPDTPFQVASLDSVTWAATNRRVAVAVTAAARDGLRLALRYELAVVRRAGRWLVKTVHVNPAAREAAP